MVKKFLLFIFATSLYFTANFSLAGAQEITILYTGDTHAMLYHCNCPKEPDGGVSRRATLIKQLRKNNPNVLVLDSGGFFASGLLDEYSQNTQLDMQRTLANLKAMELMQYDALGVGDNEFNFGREFLEANIAKYKLNFLSADIKSARLAPYVIKEISGIKVGIIGLSPVANPQKIGGIDFIDPAIAARQAMDELKKKSVDLVVVLSGLDENENLKLIRAVEGINILIFGFSSRGQEENATQIGPVLILKPSWQGRSLGKVSLVLKDRAITKYKVEYLRLSDKILDDAEVKASIPRCFSDSDCKDRGARGVCQESGTLNSRCQFIQPGKVPLLIITPKVCLTCNTERPIKLLKRYFPGLSPSYLYYPSRRADQLIKDLAISNLPAYLLGKEIEKEKDFSRLINNLEKKGNFYLVKPRFIGFTYFLGRTRRKGKLDLFLSLFDKDTYKLLGVIKEFNPTIHFLASENKDGGFDSIRGGLEAEEYLRAVCVEKYYPQVFWDYLACRAKNIYSSWWDDCLLQVDRDKIKSCAKGAEGQKLLKENISLNKELGIMFGPTYFLDNQEAFSSQGVPQQEEFRKIIKR